MQQVISRTWLVAGRPGRARSDDDDSTVVGLCAYTNNSFLSNNDLDLFNIIGRWRICPGEEGQFEHGHAIDEAARR